MSTDVHDQLAEAKALMAQMASRVAEQEAATATAKARVARAAHGLADAERIKKAQGTSTDAAIRAMISRGHVMDMRASTTNINESRSPEAVAADVERQAAFEAKLAHTKAEAAALFDTGQLSAAARLYSVLIATVRAALNARDASARQFAKGMLPSLLSNRSACLLDDETQLEQCIQDCTDALDAICLAGSSTSVSPFKVRLRRAEAYRRSGRMDECCRQSVSVSSLASTDEERNAAGYLALQVSVLSVV